ncbi:MAG TPA: fused MFS/spermidine synthase [Solirubrobacteraceae bacterium]|nr:fused MFS/spermidine synthase [Solirubrobacteraceae bacterium]
MARRWAPVVAATEKFTVLRDPVRPSGRLLRQAGMDASYVDLADPAHLEFDYLRWLRAVVEAAGARHVVHVGGAACALARALAAARPGDLQEVVELDPEALEIARRHLGLRRAPGLKVRTGEGRAVLAARADGSVDAVVVDAFVGARVPRELVTAEALAGFARVARLVALNVVDAKPLEEAAAIAAGLAGAFAHVVAVGAAPVVARRRGGNVVLVGSHAPLPLERLRARLAADRSPAVVAPFATGGAPPFRDG